MQQENQSRSIGQDFPEVRLPFVKSGLDLELPLTLRALHRLTEMIRIDQQFQQAVHPHSRMAGAALVAVGGAFLRFRHGSPGFAGRREPVPLDGHGLPGCFQLLQGLPPAAVVVRDVILRLGLLQQAGRGGQVGFPLVHFQQPGYDSIRRRRGLSRAGRRPPAAAGQASFDYSGGTHFVGID